MDFPSFLTANEFHSLLTILFPVQKDTFFFCCPPLPAPFHLPSLVPTGQVKGLLQYGATSPGQESNLALSLPAGNGHLDVVNLLLQVTPLT